MKNCYLFILPFLAAFLSPAFALSAGTVAAEAGTAVAATTAGFPFFWQKYQKQKLVTSHRKYF